MKNIIAGIVLGIALLSNASFAQDGKILTNVELQELTKACDGGNAGGCNNLGLMYDKGEGVKQDKFKAVELYKKACLGGIAGGCNDLGVKYEKGEGIRQDNSEALELYGKACDLKHELGCKNYARLKDKLEKQFISR